MATQTIEWAQKILLELSPPRAQSAIDFIRYLYEQECQEATAELEAIPGLIDAIERARKEKKTENFVSYKDIKRDV